MRNACLFFPTFLIAVVFSASGNLQAQTSTICSPGFVWDKQVHKCVSCVKPCDTGLPGVCNRGVMNCTYDPPVCEPIIRPGERMDICNGEDDDCDGQVDEGFDKDRDGYTTCGGDCNDNDAAIHTDAAERCDQIDNDCNGIIDDGFNIGLTCHVGRGACAREGKRRCSPDGTGVICDAVPGNPKPEVCDGLDNDCDGVIDNGLGEIFCGIGACRQTAPACKDGKPNRCVPLKQQEEICGDVIDNDCDGIVDEGYEKLGALCRVGQGLCERIGVFVCADDRRSLVCNAVSGEPQDEICGNHIDDDCDGQIDEGFERLGQECRTGTGACERKGKFICSDDRHSLICGAAPGKPRDEICGNGIDDDCDGIVDDDAEGLNDPCDNLQLGLCFKSGKMICDAKKEEVVCSAVKMQPKAEVCDGLDNDCDGQVDNGVLNECGACGELLAKIGDKCLVAEADNCSVGVWQCSKKQANQLECSPAFNRSEGLSCTDDGNPCTKDFCQNGSCLHQRIEDGRPCNDGDACTIADHCSQGVCQGGGLLVCDDGNPCTRDRCEKADGCVHDIIGEGRLNICGGCDVLEAGIGDECGLSNLFGICAKGQYRCTPEGDLACVQDVFASLEICNGLDDDCDGLTDEDLGETTCGVGACRTTTANCLNGSVETCIPAPPTIETCANKGSDDDCNGIVDDIENLGKSCPITIGSCIIPGSMKCVEGKEMPVCTVVQISDVEDNDADGIINYCDQDSRSSSMGAAVKKEWRLFDPAKTRSAMLPWMDLFDAVATRSDGGWLLVSGKNSTMQGLAAAKIKSLFGEGQIYFETCTIPNIGIDVPEHLANIGADTIVIASSKRYYRITDVDLQLNALPRQSCQLNADVLFDDASRIWALGSPQRGEPCDVQTVAALASESEIGNVAASAVVCELSGRPSKRWGFGMDFISLEPLAYEFVPLWESTTPIQDVSIVPSRTSGGKTQFAITAQLDGKTKAATCMEDRGKWRCAQKGASEIVGHAIINGVELPMREGGGVVLARDAYLEAVPASLKTGAAPQPSARYLPESPTDDVISTAKMSFVHPQLLVLLNAKGYGGSDLFAVFDIEDSGRKIGTMGFFFYNENESPQGSIKDVFFDGKRGSARLAFADPVGDPLTFKVHIRARHGGSLNHWIDSVEDGIVRFSAKGEAASSVGVWPIKLTVEAKDPGGLVTSSTAVIAGDGTVESIQEAAR